ncbi:hypothetical protein DFQ26_000395 [Actinomortierella ambigua]|nr:hypothetical protein DFQ26_000395 [Actinomortierella ambigua]
MIDPIPKAISGQVVLEGLSSDPTYSASSSPVSDARAPQTVEGTPQLCSTPASSPARSPHEVRLTPVPDLPTLHSGPHTYIPPPAASADDVEHERLGSSPQVYLEHASPAYRQNGIPDSSTTAGYGGPYFTPYPQHQQPYLQLQPQPYPQPVVDPTLASSTQHHVVEQQSYVQSTSHLPLDYIPLPISTESTLAMPPAPTPPSTLGHSPGMSSHPNQPYPVSGATQKSAFQGTSIVNRPLTPVKKPGPQIRKWFFTALFVVVIVGTVATAASLIKRAVDRPNSGEEVGSSPGGGGGTSSHSTSKPTESASVAAGSKPTATFSAPSSNTTGSPSQPPQPQQPQPQPPEPKSTQGPVSPVNPVEPVPPPPPPPTQQPPRPSPTPSKSEAYFTCTAPCVDAFWPCRSGCTSEDIYKACAGNCGDDAGCKIGCEFGSPCFQGCDSVKNRCMDQCGSPF